MERHVMYMDWMVCCNKDVNSLKKKKKKSKYKTHLHYRTWSQIQKPLQPRIQSSHDIFLFCSVLVLISRSLQTLYSFVNNMSLKICGQNGNPDIFQKVFYLEEIIGSSLWAQQVKELALSLPSLWPLCWCNLNTWPWDIPHTMVVAKKQGGSIQISKSKISK